MVYRMSGPFQFEKYADGSLVEVQMKVWMRWQAIARAEFLVTEQRLKPETEEETLKTLGVRQPILDFLANLVSRI